MTNKHWNESMNPALNPLCDSQNHDAPESREETVLTPEELEKLLRLCREMAAPSQDEDEEEEDSLGDNPGTGSTEDEDAAEDPDEDEDDDDEEDLDEDNEDQDEEEDEDDEDDLPNDPGILCNGKRLPLGKRIYLRQNYNSTKAYFKAVCGSVGRLLSKHSLSYDCRTLSDGTRVFLFDAEMRGISFTGHVLIDPEICDLRLEYILDVPMRKGRTALVDYFLTERCCRLRYGKVSMDHADNERKFEVSFCFYGAFAEETFERYYMALNFTVHAYCRDFEDLSSGRHLSAENRRLVRTLLQDLAENLPAVPKNSTKELYDTVVQALGSEPRGTLKRLLVYLVNRTAD